MESACCSLKFDKMVNITTMGYLWQKSSATVWGVIKLLKLAVVSKKDIYKMTASHQLFKETVKSFAELPPACRRKAVWNYRKLTHAKLM